MPLRGSRSPCSPRSRGAAGHRRAPLHYHGVVQPPATGDWIAVAEDPLPVDAATHWATTPGSGAVVVFLGVVRDNSDGRDGVRGLSYEAYEEEAVTKLHAVAAEARRQWPPVDRIALLHRTGDLELSEASVAVVVSSPHRAEAFEAARFCIDTLKETVPIWKREHWVGGSDWATGSHPVRPVEGDALDEPAVTVR
jgi:molybdopterin synthase catalytic subunit